MGDLQYTEQDGFLSSYPLLCNNDQSTFENEKINHMDEIEKEIWKNVTPNYQGRLGHISFEDGRTYKGRVVCDSIPDGQGTMTDVRLKCKFTGKWKMGKKQGLFEIVDVNGLVVNATFANDEIVSAVIHYRNGIQYNGPVSGISTPHGHGMTYWPLVQKWETGRWANGKREGIFEIDLSNCRVRRTFENNVQKSAVVHWENGDVFRGMVSDFDFKMTGEGVFFAKDKGITFKGGFEKSKFEGMGYSSCRNGLMFFGEYKNGKKNGRGVKCSGPKIEIGLFNSENMTGHVHICDIDGNGCPYIYKGGFHEGKKRGIGELWSESGYYHGQFWDDVPHGMGTKKFKDGSSFTGEWENGGTKK